MSDKDTDKLAVIQAALEEIESQALYGESGKLEPKTQLSNIRNIARYISGIINGAVSASHYNAAGEFHFWVNGKHFAADNEYLTAQQIKAISKYSRQNALFQIYDTSDKHGENKPIPNDVRVLVAYQHFFVIEPKTVMRVIG